MAAFRRSGRSRPTERSARRALAAPREPRLVPRRPEAPEGPAAGAADAAARSRAGREGDHAPAERRARPARDPRLHGRRGAALPRGDRARRGRRLHPAAAARPAQPRELPPVPRRDRQDRRDRSQDAAPRGDRARSATASSRATWSWARRWRSSATRTKASTTSIGRSSCSTPIATARPGSAWARTREWRPLPCRVCCTGCTASRRRPTGAPPPRSSSRSGSSTPIRSPTPTFHVAMLDLWSDRLEVARQTSDRGAGHRRCQRLRHLDRRPAWCSRASRSRRWASRPSGVARTERGIGLYQQHPTPPVFWPQVLILRATGLALAGRIDDALGIVDEALAIAAPASLDLAFAQLRRGQLLAARGDTAAGEAAMRLSVEVAHAWGARAVELMAATHAGGALERGSGGRHVVAPGAPAVAYRGPRHPHRARGARGAGRGPDDGRRLSTVEEDEMDAQRARQLVAGERKRIRDRTPAR